MDYIAIGIIAAIVAIVLFAIGGRAGIAHHLAREHRQTRRSEKRQERYATLNRLSALENNVLNLRNDLSTLQRSSEYGNIREKPDHV